MKKILIHIRTMIKLIILVCLATFLIGTAVVLIYRPIYSVSLNGEQIGYCADKSSLQRKISDYIEKGDGDNKNLAFISIDNMPKYKMCLLKRGITTSDDEIFEIVKNTGVAYYKYYAILDGEEEKVYVSTFEEAESVVDTLKKKNSNNIKDISINEKYETKLEKFTSVDKAVSKLYEKKVVVIAKKTTSTRGSGSSNLIRSGRSTAKVNIGVTLIKPVTGIISSRFGSLSRIRSKAHTGLDIATSSGTSVKAAAAGTVVYAGWDKYGLGNLVVISHGNGVQTYYGHCSKIYVSVGTKVSQGTLVSAVGSTGNSTGPHLHFEVRVNGIAYNPQNYVY